MAILLLKPPCTMETVNDLHGDLINLARVVQNDALGRELYGRLARTWMAELLFEDSAAVIREGPYDSDEPSVERAYHYCVMAWLGRNGMAGTSSCNSSFCLQFTVAGGHAATRWKSVIESVPAWHDRLAGVTILRRDAFELLPRIKDEKGTAMYIDPPYFSKSKKYLHDFTDEDHARLAVESGFRSHTHHLRGSCRRSTKCRQLNQNGMNATNRVIRPGIRAFARENWPAFSTTAQ